MRRYPPHSCFEPATGEIQKQAIIKLNIADIGEIEVLGNLVLHPINWLVLNFTRFAGICPFEWLILRFLVPLDVMHNLLHQLCFGAPAARSFAFPRKTRYTFRFQVQRETPADHLPWVVRWA